MFYREETVKSQGQDVPVDSEGPADSPSGWSESGAHRQETRPGTVGGAQHFSPVVSPAAVANLFRDQGTNSGEEEASQFLSNHLGDTVHGSHLKAHRERQPGSFIT